MPKEKKITPTDIEKVVMTKVRDNEITMKPKWYFVLGSGFMVMGMVGLSIGAIFLTNLTLFLLKRHGPMGQWRMNLILNSFPWWVPILALVGVGLGIWLLKKYDFAYKKNFGLMAAGFIISVIMAAWIMDYVGLNNIWSQRGPMRRFYRQLENQEKIFPRGQGQGRGKGNHFYGDVAR